MRSTIGGWKYVHRNDHIELEFKFVFITGYLDKNTYYFRQFLFTIYYQKLHVMYCILKHFFNFTNILSRTLNSILHFYRIFQLNITFKLFAHDRGKCAMVFFFMIVKGTFKVYNTIPFARMYIRS